MDSLQTVVFVNSALSLVSQLLPQISAAVQRGEVTPEQQAELMERFRSLKTQSDEQFAGPHWQINR